MRDDTDPTPDPIDPRLRDVLRQQPHAPGAWRADALDTDAAWQRLASRTIDAGARTGTAPATVHAASRSSDITVRPYRRFQWMAVRSLLPAGLVAGLFALGWLGVTHTTAPAPGGATAARVYATATGQTASLTLGDGTRVTLAPRTSLTVVTGFGARDRVVTLDGEAYFEVTRAAGAPFVVRAGGVDARVLGTAFVVRHYATDARTRVAVTSGRVAVASAARGRPPVTLTAGWVADAGDSTTTTDAAGEAVRYTAWVDGRLVFERAPTREVLDALSRWYGYRFRLADSSLARQVLTAALSTKSSAEALSALKLLLDVELTFDGNLITLTPRRDAAVPRVRPGARGEITNQPSEVGR